MTFWSCTNRKFPLLHGRVLLGLCCQGAGNEEASRGMAIRRDPRVAAAVFLMAMSSTREAAAVIVSSTSTRASSAFVQVPLRAMHQARQARSVVPAAAGVPIAGRRGFSSLLSRVPLSQAPSAAGSTVLPPATRVAGGSSAGWMWRNSATRAAGASVRMCASAAKASGEVVRETVQGDVIGIEGNLATVKVSPCLVHAFPRPRRCLGGRHYSIHAIALACSSVNTMRCLVGQEGQCPGAPCSASCAASTLPGTRAPGLPPPFRAAAAVARPLTFLAVIPWAGESGRAGNDSAGHDSPI